MGKRSGVLLATSGDFISNGSDGEVDKDDGDGGGGGRHHNVDHNELDVDDGFRVENGRPDATRYYLVDGGNIQTRRWRFKNSSYG